MSNTKQEGKFFSIAEKLCFEFDDNGKYSFERYDYELSHIIENFKDEIIKNCTKLSQNEREFYLNRLKNRLHPIGLDYYFIEKKNGQFIENDDGTLSVEKGKEIEYEQLIPLSQSFEYKGVLYTIEPEQAKQYYSMLRHYKRILLRLITEITTDRNKPEPERLADHSKLLEALNEHITGINTNEFTNIIERQLITPGTPPARWIGEKVDACYFCDHLNITHRVWNKLFYFPDGKKIHTKYKDKLEKGSPIIEILKTHLSK